MKTVGQFKNDIYRNIAPARPSDSKDVNGAIESAAEKMLSEVKPKELSKRVIVENALYDQVNRYTCPDDLDTNKIMQWYRLAQDKASYWFRNIQQVSNRDFDLRTGRHKEDSSSVFTIEYQSGKKFIKVNDKNQVNSELVIHTMDSVSDNGLWNVFGNTENIARDDLTYVTGSGSIRVDINDSFNEGGIVNTTLQPVDITEYLNVGKVFTWLDLPQLNGVISVRLDLHSDTNDYYSITVTRPHDTNQFQLGQNLLGFRLDRETMNTIGNPDPKNINEVRLTFVTTATFNLNSVRIDNIVARKGDVYGIQYISNRVFKSPQSQITYSRPQQDSDEIILEYDTYQLLLAFASYELGRELLTDKQDVQNLEKDMLKAVIVYKKRNKEEFIDQTQSLRNFGVNYGYYGNGWNSDDRHRDLNN
jgi:hypothetical protein